ncbi:C-X-C chemokine receptor type 3-like [Eucyclogobius newberryi]|uniref:C-X-C chemokine receptor type 3-like n=1 Tax=Eucyclogobius newberryi TaxID=166745 RepID=UPI003B5C5104
MATDLEVDLGGLFLLNGTYDYDSDYTFEEELEPKAAKAVLIPLVLSLVLALGVPGQALIMVFLGLKKQSWSSSDIFVLHLGLTDVLLLITLPFWAAQAALPLGWCCGLFWCRINGALFNISFYCGMLLLLCITGERFLNIIHSVQLFTKTPQLAHFTCLVIWLFSVLLGVPDWVSMLYIEEKNEEGENVCSCNANIYSSKWQIPVRVIHHVTFLLPVVVLTVFFYFLLKRLQDFTKALERLRAVMLILTLVLVFFICWTPYNVTLMTDTWKSRSKTYVTGKTALQATLALACVHACLRPLIYLVLCEKFHKSTLAAVKCRTEELKGDLWELGVGSKNMPGHSSDPEEMKQMNIVEQQLQSDQC